MALLLACFSIIATYSGCASEVTTGCPESEEKICRPDCEHVCPVTGVICDEGVNIVGLECEEQGPACGGVRFCCAH